MLEDTLTHKATVCIPRGTNYDYEVVHRSFTAARNNRQIDVKEPSVYCNMFFRKYIKLKFSLYCIAKVKCCHVDAFFL